MTEREQLEQAIAAQESLRATLGDAVVDATVATLRRRLAELQPVSEQRKLITVLFADVVGSTRLSQGRDPEEILEIMDGALKRLAAPIAAHGGRVTRFMGDGLKAVFGLPVAHENDAECAVRAGLDLLAVAHAYAAELEARRGLSGFAVRVGLNTGLVATGGFSEAEDTVMGLTINLGARMESAAAPDSVLISRYTYQHVRGLFDVEVLPPVAAKGFAEPVPVYRVHRARPRAFRMNTRGVEGVETRMVGREAELRRLQDAFRAVFEHGTRQVVTVAGEAGVGKSRLLYELEAWALEQYPETCCLKGRAGQELQHTPYALLRDLFASHLQIRESDPAGAARQMIESGICAVLGVGASGMMKAHVIGQLLGFDFGDSPHLQGVLDDARQLRDRGLLYVVEFLNGLAGRQPVLLLLEDLHWADDSSLDALDRLARSAAGHPLSIVGATRPTLYERRPQWGAGQAFHARLDLAPLSERASLQLMVEILQKVEDIPQKLRDLLVAGAEGNPFYMEELIKMLVEDGVIVKGAERWRVEPEPLTAMRVPPTLAGVLQARLDNLPPEERSVLQQASVTGRQFWDQVVVRIQSAEDDAAQAAVAARLGALQGREMIFRQAQSAFAGAEEYLFKHAMLREVAYESVLRRLRRVYHGLVADWLLEQSGERVGEYLGLVAGHLALAGRQDEAREYLQRAGERAAAQYANAEATGYFSRALELTPETNADARYALLLARERVCDLQGARELQGQDLAALAELARASGRAVEQCEVALRQAVYAEVTGDYPAAIAAAQEAVALAGAAGERGREAAAQVVWGKTLWRQGDAAGSRDHLGQALVLAENTRRDVEADSLRELGTLAYAQGNIAEAQQHYQQSLTIAREIGDRSEEAASLRNLGIAAWTVGDAARAREYHEQSLAIRREIGDRRGEAVGLANVGGVAYRLGDHAGAGEYFEQSLAIRREIGDRMGEAYALMGLGSATSALGDYATARDQFAESAAICHEIGDRQGEWYALMGLGRIVSALGDHGRAREHLAQSLAINRETGDRHGEGDILTGLGAVCLAQGDVPGAEAYQQQSRAVFREIGEPEGEGYALTGLGEALAAQGRWHEAVAAFQQAVDLRRGLSRPALTMESLAGLASARLAQGELDPARDHVAEILVYLDAGNGLNDADQPALIYLTCYRVLRAVRDPRAREMLVAAHGLLHERAARIPDEQTRAAFLANIAHHREIVREFAQVE